MIARAPTVWECNWLQVKENSMDPAHLAFLHTLPGSQRFTEDLGALGEWDWMETPVGMVYIDTRRQSDRVWVRVADFIPPNIPNFRRTPTRWPSAQRSTARRPRHGRFPSTTPTRCRSDSTAHPRARNHGGVRASGRMRAGPTKTGSGSPAITMRKSASMAASPGTVSNTSPRPIGV